MLGERWGVFWLLRTYRFVAGLESGLPEAMQARIDAFATHILAESTTHQVDEVILVGHSVGSILAIEVLAAMQRQSPASPLPIKLLTLGQCMPLLGFLPQAHTFRHALQQVAVPWVDYTAVADPLAYSNFGAAGLLPQAVVAQGYPVQRYMRPFRMFSASAYRKLRRNKLRLHFQYLMASELETDYDYFHLTAGPQLLGHPAV